MTAVFSRIGCLSFGGPAGQIALMHRVIIEERRWISEERFLHALNYCMLLPGPEAQQLATYIGWLMFGTRGGIIAGLLFVLPGLLVMIALSAAYALYQETTWLTGFFLGLKAAVLAIVVEAVIRLGRKTLRNRRLVVIAALAFLGLFFFGLPFPLIVVLAALAGFLAARARRSQAAPPGPADLPQRPPFLRAVVTLAVWILVWLAPMAILGAMSGAGALADLFAFFAKMAMVTFGGAYAVLAYVAQVAVQDYGWLRPGEMLDGLALAETTPGPLVLVLCFVGFLVGFREAAGLGAVAGSITGALLVAWATFVPSFIWIFAGAPYIERLRGNETFSAALSAITAAVVGVILNLAIWFGLHVFFAELRQIEILPSIGLGFIQPVWVSFSPVLGALFLLSAFLLFRLRLGMVPLSTGGRMSLPCASSFATSAPVFPMNGHNGMTERIENLSQVISGYDVVLSDVWGVVHNGVDAFQQSCRALAGARDAGATVVLITNSPRPAPGVIQQMKALGVPDGTYDRIVTSGDVTRHLIAEGPRKVFLLGPERDMPLFEGLDVDVVAAASADAIVCTGFFDDEKEVPEDYRDLLTEFARRDIPFICANPDLVVERGHKIIPCAGAVAAFYEQLGGKTRIAGKPHKHIYDASLAAARETRGEFSRERVLAIGDGMPTDVRGALAAGLDLLYVSGGIHVGEYTVNGETDEAILKAWLKSENAAPKFWMPRLAVLERALDLARQRELPAMVLTFEPHPRTVFRPEAPVFRLTPAPLKARLLETLGFRSVIEYPFDREFATRSAEEFIQTILIDWLHAHAVVTGFDFHFGKGREGGPAFLMASGAKHGFEVSLMDAFRDENAEVISSSRIRSLLAEGEVAEAAGLLGYRYTVEAEVIGGEKLGRQLGYPTANMRLPPETELKPGIYAVRFRRADGRLYDGVASYGRRPTVTEDGAPLLETFVFDFSDSLYGEICAVSFCGHLRDELKFDGLEPLVAQIKRDEDEARALLSGVTPLSPLDASIAFAPEQAMSKG
eukprot:g25244.t1